MTTPPSFSKFVDAILNQANHLRTELEREAEQDVAFAEPFKKAFEEIDKFVQNVGEFKKAQLAKKDATQIQNDNSAICVRVQKIVQDTFDEIGCSQEKITNELANLKQNNDVFNNLWEKKSAIDSSQVTSYSFEELAILVKADDRWAIDILTHQLERDQEQAVELLFSSVRDPQLFYSFRNKAWLRKTIEVYLQKNETKNLGFDFIHAILRIGECDWAQSILSEQLTKPSPQLCVNLLLDIYRSVDHSQAWIIRLTSNLLCQECVGACLFYYHLFASMNKISELESIASQFFWDFSTKKMFLCILACLPDESDCKIDANFVLSKLPINNQYWPDLIELNKCLDRLKAKAGLLSKPYYINDKFDRYEPLYCLFIIKQTINREVRLIEYFLDPQSFQCDFSNPPMSDCYPRTESILIARDPNEAKKQADKFTHEICDFVKSDGIEVVGITHANLDEIEDRPNLSLITGQVGHSPWVRDCVIAFQNTFKIPCPPMISLAEVEDSLTQKREHRIRSELSGNSSFDELDSEFLDFGTLGLTMTTRDQLAAASYLVNPPTFSRIDSNFITFGFYEFGNMLFGEEEQGGKYVITGKDTIELNRFLLTRELYDLGFRKDGSKIVRNHDPKMDLVLNDDEIKRIISIDLNVSNVYLIENFDYHIDMGASILRDKTVLLVDSSETTDLWDKYARKKMSQENFQYDPNIYGQEYRYFLEESKTKIIVENLVERQLTEQGFRVVRMGGGLENLFKKKPAKHRVNLLNYLSLTTPQGKKVVVTFDCDPVYKDAFERIINEYTETHEIYYLSHQIGRHLLNLSGGVHCAARQLSFKLDSQ